jgi:hypothetical protein
MVTLDFFDTLYHQSCGLTYTGNIPIQFLKNVHEKHIPKKMEIMCLLILNTKFTQLNMNIFD